MSIVISISFSKIDCSFLDVLEEMVTINLTIPEDRMNKIGYSKTKRAERETYHKRVYLPSIRVNKMKIRERRTAREANRTTRKATRMKKPSNGTASYTDYRLKRFGLAQQALANGCESTKDAARTANDVIRKIATVVYGQWKTKYYITKAYSKASKYQVERNIKQIKKHKQIIKRDTKRLNALRQRETMLRERFAKQIKNLNRTKRNIMKYAERLKNANDEVIKAIKNQKPAKQMTPSELKVAWEMIYKLLDCFDKVEKETADNGAVILADFDDCIMEADNRAVEADNRADEESAEYRDIWELNSVGPDSEIGSLEEIDSDNEQQAGKHGPGLDEFTGWFNQNDDFQDGKPQNNESFDKAFAGRAGINVKSMPDVDAMPDFDDQEEPSTNVAVAANTSPRAASASDSDKVDEDYFAEKDRQLRMLEIRNKKLPSAPKAPKATERRLATCSLATDHDAPHGLFILVPIAMILMLVVFFLGKPAQASYESLMYAKEAKLRQ